MTKTKRIIWLCWLFLQVGMHSEAQKQRGMVWVNGASISTSATRFNANNTITQYSLSPIAPQQYAASHSNICDSNGKLFFKSMQCAAILTMLQLPMNNIDAPKPTLFLKHRQPNRIIRWPFLSA
jgi:hypothetical protein